MPVQATCLDLLTVSFVRAGVYGIGETIQASDATYAQNIMNAMLDQWSNEKLMVFAYLQQSGLLIPGQQTYTIGPGGDFDMVRPLSIGDVPGSAYVLDSDGNRYPITVIQQQDWNLIPNVQVVTSNYPDTLFYDPQYPLGNMNFYPTPDVGYTAFWYSQLPLQDLDTLSTPLVLPPGYVKAIRDNLAIELWPDYREGDPSAALIRSALESKSNIKRINTKTRLVHFDAELSSRSRVGTWNWYQGAYPSS